MILHPKKTKFRKAFKGRIHGKAKGGFKIAFGKFALKALEPERIQEKQIESARKAINRHLRRAGKLWIRIFPDIPGTRGPRHQRGVRKRHVHQHAHRRTDRCGGFHPGS